MRLRHLSTVDRTIEDRYTPSPSRPNHPVYFCTRWHLVPKHRPWFHVRYHSSFPVLPDVYETLHLLLVHTLDESPDHPDTSYLLPHEAVDPERLPRVFGFCRETSNEQYSPQTIGTVAEIESVQRKIMKRMEPESWTRLDFLTREPLDVVTTTEPFSGEWEDVTYVYLHDTPFNPITVRQTRRERAERSWALKMARDGGEVSGQTPPAR